VPELKLLFLEMAVILMATRLAAAVFRRLGQPAVVGEIAAGILLGPSVLGHFAPGIMNGLFPPSNIGPLYALSEVGVVLFMFMVGLEVRPSLLRNSTKSVILASHAGILAPLLLGGALAWILYPQLGSGAPKLPFVLFVGAALSVTAFPVLARILSDRKMMDTHVGIFAISYAAFNDIAAWCILAIIAVIARPATIQTSLSFRFVALTGYALVMWFVIRPALLRFLPLSAVPSLQRLGVLLVLLLLSAWATEELGFHPLFGAFMAGIIVPKGGNLHHEIRGRLEAVTVILLLPLFFAYNGLRTSVGLLDNSELWFYCGLIVIAAVGSKLVVSALVIHRSGMPWRESLAIGVLVNTKGLVELVILNVGLDLHILSPTVFSMMVIMALVTTFMTTPLLDRIMPRAMDVPEPVTRPEISYT
jgi:Kef-type K+ transport system membrane component KefB